MHEITPSQPYPSAQGRRLSPPGTPKFDDTMRRSPTGAHGATRTFHRVHETGAHARATGPIAEPPSAIEQPGDRWDDDLLTTTATTQGEDNVRAYDSAAHAPRESLRAPAPVEEPSLEDTWRDLDTVAEELGLSAAPPPYETLSVYERDPETEAVLDSIPDLSGAIDAFRSEQAAAAAEQAAQEARERRSALMARAEQMNFGTDEETARMRRRINAIRRNIDKL